MKYKYELKIRKDKELEEYTCKIESLQSDPAILLDTISNLVEAPVSPMLAEEIKKAVQQDRREIIELLENYLLDTNHCFEIEKLKFVNKLSFADLILSIARGLIYGK